MSNYEHTKRGEALISTDCDAKDSENWGAGGQGDMGAARDSRRRCTWRWRRRESCGGASSRICSILMGRREQPIRADQHQIHRRRDNRSRSPVTVTAVTHPRKCFRWRAVTRWPRGRACWSHQFVQWAIKQHSRGLSGTTFVTSYRRERCPTHPDFFLLYVGHPFNTQVASGIAFRSRITQGISDSITHGASLAFQPYAEAREFSQSPAMNKASHLQTPCSPVGCSAVIPPTLSCVNQLLNPRTRIQIVSHSVRRLAVHDSL